VKDNAIKIASDAAALLPIDLARRYRIVPIRKEERTLHVGITAPIEQDALDIVRFHTGLTIIPVMVTADKLNELLENYSKLTAQPQLALELLKELPLEEEIFNVKEQSAYYEEPLIKFVDNIIRHALQKSASDIHIEPFEKECRIRYRQDGILYPIAEIPAQFAARVVTRLKVMAALDIAERRLPQDGRFQLEPDSIDLRINICPTVHGEKAVLRILDGRKAVLDIDALGFTASQKTIFIEKISRPQGMVLVTGPTGSGKTVTLYSALRYLNTSDKNISTIENPVEIHMHGINQVNINPKIGLHFAAALRTFLRQDPDIMMVGEIRDVETAEIAIQAAQTGHLILSSVHTNSAIDTFTRLQTMGIETYHLAHSISLIIAQRLARKLCPHCKSPDAVGFKANGCELCLEGYQGRTGIYEFLPLTENITPLFLAGAPKQTIIDAAHCEGLLTLQAAGFEKIKAGITSLTEINRIIKQ
jgi:type IV pilus assembly protein PilB